jgi:hypothetical protein
VAFRIPDCRPGLWSRKFGAKNGSGTDSFNRDSDIRDVEKENGLVRRRVALDSFALQADKPVADGELGVVVGIVFIESQPEGVSVKLFRRVEIVKVELDAGKAVSRGGHALLLPILMGKEADAPA